MRFSIICSSNKQDVLNENLLRSPGINEHEVIVVFGADNVPNAYNRAVKIATEDVLIFVHQDVFMPDGFFHELEESISKLADEKWGILGPIGVRIDENTGDTIYLGDMVDRGNRTGKNDSLPEQVQTLDEMMLICRKEVAIFDENIPTKHHMHGADICLNSISNGYKNFAVKAFCYHNCFTLSYELPDEFYLASDYVRDKWSDMLPIVTTCIRLDKKIENDMKCLDEIARENQTDKSSEIHNYCEKYEKYLKFDRQRPIKILEIGVLFGSSVKTWSEFYPNSVVVGIDINPHCKTYESDRIKIEIGSQDDIDFLQSVVDKYGDFDMILDDGSHMQQHVLTSFEFLFKHLANGGTYVVEDSCCAYWPDFGGGLHAQGSSVEYFKKLVDDVNFNGYFCDNFEPNHARREDMLENTHAVKASGIRTDIESINFLNSIVIINKR